MVYTLELELYTDYFAPKFAFDAESEKNALDKAHSWGRYHSFAPSMIRVREATENESLHWMHNEYMVITNIW